MPATNSVAFANNRGGSGKTFLVFQLACEAARARPSSKVLVIDFSLYSETSALLMGGLARADPLAATKGLDNTEKHTTSDNRTEGLVRALVLAAGAGPHDSVFGKWFVPKPTAAVDLLKYAVRPFDCDNPRIPSNLYLVASAGKTSWGENTTNHKSDGTAEVPMWARQHSTEWWPAAQQLKQAFARLSGDWTVFADTDHLAASPLTKLAFGAMERIVVPLSLDQGDFSRLFHDPTGNALFTDVLMPMSESGKSSARVSKFIFTKLASQDNTVTETKAGITSSFKPSALAQEEMANIADSLRHVAKGNPVMQSTLYGFNATSGTDDGALVRPFCEKFFTAFKQVADGPANVSKTAGAPLCTMDSNHNLGKTKPDKKTLDALKAELRFTVLSIFGEDYQLDFPGLHTHDGASPPAAAFVSAA